MANAVRLRTLLLRDAILPGVIASLLLAGAFTLDRGRNLQGLYAEQTTHIAERLADTLPRRPGAAQSAALQAALVAGSDRHLARIEVHEGATIFDAAGPPREALARHVVASAAMPRRVGQPVLQVTVFRGNAPLVAELQRTWLAGAIIAAGIGLLAWLATLRLLAHTARPMEDAGEALAALVRGDADPQPVAGGTLEANALGRQVDGVRAYLRGLIARTSSDRLTTDTQNLTSLRDAAAALRSKGRFLAETSHHFRQPLQTLQLYVTGLRAEAGDAHREALLQMQRGIDDMTVLLDGLLELSQLDAGLVKPNARAFALADLLRRELAPLRDDAARAGVEVLVRAGGCVLYTDGALLGRLLRQLVTNAIRHAPGGRVLVAVRRRGRGARIEVRDNGEGIAIIHHRRIFDEFVQLGEPDAPSRPGYGLGLALASRLARVLRSRIEIRSAPGRGSIFWLDLPRLPANLAPPQRWLSA